MTFLVCSGHGGLPRDTVKLTRMLVRDVLNQPPGWKLLTWCMKTKRFLASEFSSVHTLECSSHWPPTTVYVEINWAVFKEEKVKGKKAAIHRRCITAAGLDTHSNQCLSPTQSGRSTYSTSPRATHWTTDSHNCWTN